MNRDTVFVYENSLGSVTFSYKSPFWITEIDGASSVDVVISSSHSPQQAGEKIASQRVKEKILLVSGCIFEPLRENRKKLIDIMSPCVNSTLTIIENGESWYLDVVPVRTPEIDPGEGVQNFQMRLYAAYPYWRTTEEYATQIAGITPLFKFPFYTGGTWWISRFSNDYFKTIDNAGNVPIGFRVVFTARGALSNPELYHMDTKKKILIKKDMVAGERIVVSTIYGEAGVMAASSDGVRTNGNKYLSIESDLTMAIVPGKNLLRIGASSNREGLRCTIEAPSARASYKVLSRGKQFNFKSLHYFMMPRSFHPGAAGSSIFNSNRLSQYLFL